ncbi:uncharacterized protein METZ01_LOCUS245848, partial [marine metagenome]
VPIYITFGSESDTAIAPTDALSKYPSEILCQEIPASLVFHTPPAQAPK